MEDDMRSTASVLLAVLMTVVLFVCSFGISDSMLWGEVYDAFGFTISVFGVIFSVIVFLICVFGGRKADQNDAWSEEKKSNGWLSYILFVLGIYCFSALVLLDPVNTFLEIFFCVVLFVLMVVSFALGSICLVKVAQYENALDETQLAGEINDRVEDYTRVKRALVTYRAYDGGEIEVTIKNGTKSSKVVIDFEPDETWLTTTGRTVRYFTTEQWAIFVFEDPRHVKVYQSRLHTN